MPLIRRDPNGRDARPVQIAIRMIGGKWKALILIELDTKGVLRFKELQRRLHPISQKVLTRALRHLQSDGLITRASFSEMPLRVEYCLTERSGPLLPILTQLDEWVQRLPAWRTKDVTAEAALVYRR
jgi:DNA-binding HxlR family transcriptional regulator